MLMATYGANPDERKQYLFLQALHGLVRLAKAERMLEIQRSIDLASGGQAAVWRQKEASAVRRRTGAGYGTRPRHIELGGKHGGGE